MDLQLKPLYQLLQEGYNHFYGYIYLQRAHPWSVNSMGLLYYTDRTDPVFLEDAKPDFVRSHKLQRVMQIGRVEDAMRNAFNQKEHPTVEELAACFNFHYLYSGYLDLNSFGTDAD